MKLLKIGEVAKTTGVSVRTLHHYDQIGLLQPSDQSDSGHRLYSSADVEKLQQIVSLRSMGFPLKEIERGLHAHGLDLIHVLRMQETVVKEQISDLKRIQKRLACLLHALSLQDSASTNELLALIKEITRMEQWNKLYTKKQIDTLTERYRAYPDQVKEVERAWPILFQKFEKAMLEGKEPSCEEVQLLAQEAQRFIDLFTGGDKEIEANLNKAYEQNQESALNTWGVKKEVFEYATEARRILNK